VEVTLPDGAVVLAHGRLDLVPADRPALPAFALYLDERWRDDPVVAWPHVVAEWPDFGLPADEAALFATIVDLHQRARAGAIVEIACYGGIGRTGTVLSCFAVAAGIDEAVAAVAWVRAHYHGSAVETKEQEALVERFAAYLAGSSGE
jgi:rhodanese/phosphatase family protein